MNKRTLAVIATSYFCASTLFADTSLQVTVTNVTSTKGKIHIGIYTKNQDFPNHEAKHYKKVLMPKIGSVKTTITGLPEGEYAVAVLHDINDNDKLDKNFLGMPKEPYGFFRAFKPVFSAPSFAACKFKLHNGANKVSIKLLD